jgi:hypothetical protein
MLLGQCKPHCPNLVVLANIAEMYKMVTKVNGLGVQGGQISNYPFCVCKVVIPHVFVCAEEYQQALWVRMLLSLHHLLKFQRGSAFGHNIRRHL